MDHDNTFRVIPGDPESSVVIHVPHASRELPQAVRDEIVLDDDELAAELDAMTDAYTDLIASAAADLARGPRPWIFVNELSRLVVDPERYADDREEMNAVGMGAVYTHTSTGTVLRKDEHVDELMRTYYQPYAEAMSSLVQERLADTGSATIIDLHSYPVEPLPYETHPESQRPEICFGTDHFHTGGYLVRAAARAFDDFEIALNTPFAGSYVPPGHLQADHDVHSLMVEIRRDLYLDDGDEFVAPAVSPIADSLATLVDTWFPPPAA